MILDVDLIAFERGDRPTRDAVVAGTLASLESGFVYTRHDIPEALLDDAYGKLREFFDRAPEVKERSVAAGSRGQAGYTGLSVETAAGRDVADFKEMLNWGHVLPRGHPLRERFPHRYLERHLPEEAVPGITAALGRLHDRLADLQHRFLRIIAAGLGLSDGFFDGMTKDGATLTRAIHYPAMEGAPDGDVVWAGEHGDINLITALPRATAPGLQVRTADGWIDAAPPEGHAIVNTGMMLTRLTNGRIPTGIHRVVSSEPGERLSVVQFCHPTPWTVLTPVATCVTPERPLRYSSVEAGAWLDEVLWQINLT